VFNTILMRKVAFGCYAVNYPMFVKKMAAIQSRQTAKLFLQSSELGPPTTSHAGECDPPGPPPHLVPGVEHTRLRERGWGSPNSNEGTYTVVLCIYMYFCGLQIRHLLYDYIFPCRVKSCPHTKSDCLCCSLLRKHLYSLMP
jgi:hypothetical protein